MSLRLINISVPLITILFLLIACQNNSNKNDKKIEEETIYDIKRDSIFIFDTTGKTQSQRLQKLMEISVLKSFDEERKEFIEATTSDIYQVSEIVKKGKTFLYEVISEEYEIGIKYNCIPSKGEYTKDIIGKDSIVKLYYDKVRLMTKWDECIELDGNKSCTALKQIEKYPVKTFFKFDYIRMSNGLMHLSYFRKHIPEPEKLEK